MKKKYQSEILMVCHQNAEALHRHGIIGDAKMREFDEGCLVHDIEKARYSYPAPSANEFNDKGIILAKI